MVSYYAVLAAVLFSLPLVIDSFTNTLLATQNHFPTSRHSQKIVSYLASFTPAVSTDSTRSPPSSTFWNNLSKVSSLSDQPPKEILEKIRLHPYRGGFEPTQNIDWYEPRIIHGSIPKDLIGTLTTNGPGRIRIGSHVFGHWFDGDGYITELVLDGKTGSAWFHGRYVETDRYIAQEALMKTLMASSGQNQQKKKSALNYPPFAFCGPWTPRGYGRWYENIFRFPQNPANTATMWLEHEKKDGDAPPRLFAVCEGGLPIEVNPTTLKPVGHNGGKTTSFSINNNQHWSAEKTNLASFFSAHFSRCPSTGDIYNHGYVLRPFLPPRVNLMHFKADGTLVRQRQTEMPYDTLIHDGTLTSKFVIYLVPPWRIPKDYGGLVQSVLGLQTFASQFEWGGGSGGNYDEKSDDRGLGTLLFIHDRSDLTLRYKVSLPRAASLYHIVDADDAEEENGSAETNPVVRIRVAELEEGKEGGWSQSRPKLERQFGDPYRLRGEEGDRQLYCRLREYEVRCTWGNEALGAAAKGNGGCSVTVRDVGVPSTRSQSTSSPNVETDKGAPTAPAICEFPAISPNYNPSSTTQTKPSRRRRYCWTNAASQKSIPWLDGVQKVDMMSHDNGSTGTSPVVSFGAGSYAGAPAFLPKHWNGANDRKGIQEDCEEDDGYIATTIYRSDEHRSDVAILCAKTMKVLCVIALGNHVPYQFHGDFVCGYKAHIDR